MVGRHVHVSMQVNIAEPILPTCLLASLFTYLRTYLPQQAYQPTYLLGKRLGRDTVIDRQAFRGGGEPGRGGRTYHLYFVLLGKHELLRGGPVPLGDEPRIH